MKNISTKTYLISALVISVFCLSGVIWYKEFHGYVSTNDAQINSYYTSIGPDILARITKLHVDEGDMVKKGELIVNLDDTIPLSKKHEVEAKIATLQSVKTVKYYQHLKMKNDFERFQKGYQEGVSTYQEFDHAQKNLEITKAELDVSEKDLEHAIKELEVVNTQLWHTTIYAPFDGVVAKRWAFNGDVMQPGQTIFSIYDLNNLWVLANLEETKMEKVSLGDSVQIHIDTYPDFTFYGKIFVIKDAAASQFSFIPQDNATGNYTKVAQRIPIKISIDKVNKPINLDQLYLLPGMSAEVKIKTK